MSVFVGKALRLFGLRASFLAGPLSHFFGLALRLSLGRSTSFLFGSLPRLLRLTLRLPLRCYAILFVGPTLGFFRLAALRLSLDGEASFLLSAMSLRCRASLFVGSTLRFLGRASAQLLFAFALPLRRGTGCYLGAVLGFFCLTSLCLSLRRNASLLLSAAMRFFCLAGLRLLHGCSTSLPLVAPPSRAHDDSDDRGCERKTNPADDEKHLHDWKSTPSFCPPTAGHLPLRSRRVPPARSRRASAHACRQ